MHTTAACKNLNWSNVFLSMAQQSPYDELLPILILLIFQPRNKFEDMTTKERAENNII